MIVKTLKGTWTRRCPRCLVRLEKTDAAAPWSCVCGWPALGARELRFQMPVAVVCTGLALLLGGCAAPHTALLCHSVTVGPQNIDAWWCTPTNKVPMPPVTPRKPDAQT